MRILLTGGSSFTGLWFARSLAASRPYGGRAAQGQTATIPACAASASPSFKRVAEVVEGLSVRLGPLSRSRLARGSWDLLCQHAAQTGDYRNPDFDILGAVADNTHNVVDVLKTMLARGLAGVVLTGSVFEQDEGAGDAPLRAFSPYGLSKGLTWQYYRFLSRNHGFPARQVRHPESVRTVRGAALLQLSDTDPGSRARCRRCAPRSTCATTFMSICWRQPMRPSLRACPPRRA